MYVSDWSGDNGLNLNRNECVQGMFSLKGTAVTDLDLKAYINGNALSQLLTLEDKFSNNAKC